MDRRSKEGRRRHGRRRQLHGGRSIVAGLLVVGLTITGSPNRVEAGPPGTRSEVRSIDGTGNNRENPEWGAAVTPFVRLVTPAYGPDNAPAGDDRPSARSISNVVVAQSESMPNAGGLSDFVWQWGQFLDHDIDETPIIVPLEPFPIAVPLGDPWFDPDGNGDVVIPLARSFHVEVDGPREQVNFITAYIDASNVYGSDDERALALRRLDGSGKLKTSRGRLLPFNTEGLPNAPVDDDPSFFLAGDVRANEQVGLTAMHTLFVREHNFWAGRIARELEERDRRDGRRGRRSRLERDEAIYQAARRIVAAEMQVITYRDFLPIVLGPNALPPYAGYDASRDAGIRNEFATAAYRFGHSMLSPVLLRLDAQGRTIEQGDLPLAEAFFRPDVILDHGIEPLLRGLASQAAQEVDAQVVDAIRNFLFGPPGSGGFDLASLNIQRGRDHGLPSFNDTRRDLGLAPAVTFADISSDAAVANRLAKAYGDIESVDLWMGGLAEDDVPGALVGETFHAILAEQFAALRDGDRFWYERDLGDRARSIVERQTLARIIRRNTAIYDEIPDDVFVAR